MTGVGRKPPYFSTVLVFSLEPASSVLLHKQWSAQPPLGYCSLPQGWTLAKWMLLQETAPQPNTQANQRRPFQEASAHWTIPEDSSVWQLLDHADGPRLWNLNSERWVGRSLQNDAFLANVTTKMKLGDKVLVYVCVCLCDLTCCLCLVFIMRCCKMHALCISCSTHPPPV